MANQFSYLSVVPYSQPRQQGAGAYGVVQFLNTDWMTGGGTGTVTVTQTSYVITGSGAVTVGTNGSTVVVYAPSQTSFARSDVWQSMLGVAVQSNAPSNPAVYSDWTNGSSGVWGWMSIP